MLGREEKERVSARSAAALVLPACSMKLLFNAFSCIGFTACARRDDTAVGFDGANAVLDGAIDVAARNERSDVFMIIVD